MFAVIDTNVIVASLLTRNHDSATARVMDAVYSGKVTPLVCDEMLAEYADVLYRPRLKLDAAKCEYILSLISDIGKRIDPTSSAVEMPDEDDRVFLEVAMAGQSEGDSRLVTGNLRHYPKADFIVTPADFCALLGI